MIGSTDLLLAVAEVPTGIQQEEAAKVPDKPDKLLITIKPIRCCSCLSYEGHMTDNYSKQEARLKC